MNPEETIFAEALSKGSVAERAAYVIQACAGNDQLRRDVEALLLAHERAAGILEGSPIGLDVTTAPRPSSETVGSTVGPYKLLEQIGGGGMGVVYMAEQLRPVRRKVALKIIKPGMDSGQVIARFEAERQALTMMDHPNIAKVLDAGTTDAGRPYFVMELVKGIPITDYCDQARLTTRQRLELFMQVCHAVQHAHQKGVIHRDLKPTNVLVTLHDDKPVPKVIDFGIAKAAGQVLTERTLFTNYAQLLGTPLYMSPEQAQISGLDVDTRSDVYSLGVLLYELLTGTTPFDKQRLREAAYDEIRRIIREEDPPKPSTRISTMGEKLTAVSQHRHTDPKHLGQLVRGELDWIVMKALEKDRTRRYETANGLARDVERHLRDEAVQACPPSGAYRFRKFVRRHRVGFLIASTALAALMLLVIGLAVSNVVITRERNQKAAALAEAELQRRRAEANLLKARIAIRDVLTGPATGAGEWAQLPKPLRMKFADEALKHYQSLVQGSNADPSARYETAVGYRSLSHLVGSAFGDREKSVKLARDAIEILEALCAEHPSVVEYRHELAWSNYVLGQQLIPTNLIAEAQAAFQKAFDINETLLRESPDSRNYRASLVNSGGSLARMMLRSGEPEQAECILRRSLEAYEGATDYPGQPNVTSAAAECHDSLHTILAESGRLSEAEQSSRRAAAIYEKLATESPNDPRHRDRLAWCQYGLSNLLRGMNRVNEADEAALKAIARWEKLVADFPTEPKFQNFLAWALVTRVDPNPNDFSRAVELAESAIKLAPNNGNIWNTLGAAHYRAGDFPAAAEALRKAVDLRKGADGFDGFLLAMTNWQLGDKDEARRRYDQAVAWMDKHQPNNDELRRFRAEATELIGVKE